MSDELAKYEVLMVAECNICGREFPFMKVYEDTINDFCGRLKKHMNAHKKKDWNK